MLKIASKHEELLQEVENLMEERYLKGLSAGIKNAVKKRMLKANTKRN
jgi:metal-responsive CopG/Arc/MetJ family transcriptional regulator